MRRCSSRGWTNSSRGCFRPDAFPLPRRSRTPPGRTCTSSVWAPPAIGGVRRRHASRLRCATSLAPLLKAGALAVGKSTVPVGTASRLLRTLRGRDAAAGNGLPRPRRWSRSPQTRSWPPRSPSSMRCPRCARPPADVVALAEAIGHDDRIGAKFLGAGVGFGGGCLPKDIRAFMARAGELGADKALTFLREVDHINLRRRARMVDLAREACGGTLIGKRVSVLGAAFKPNSDDVRDSPALDVAQAARRRRPGHCPRPEGHSSSPGHPPRPRLHRVCAGGLRGRRRGAAPDRVAGLPATSTPPSSSGSWPPPWSSTAATGSTRTAGAPPARPTVPSAATSWTSGRTVRCSCPVPFSDASNPVTSGSSRVALSTTGEVGSLSPTPRTVAIYDPDRINPYGRELAALLSRRAEIVHFVPQDAPAFTQISAMARVSRRIAPARHSESLPVHAMKRLLVPLTVVLHCAVRRRPLLVVWTRDWWDTLVLTLGGRLVPAMTVVNHNPTSIRPMAGLRGRFHKRLLAAADATVVHSQRLVPPAALDSHEVWVAPHPPYREWVENHKAQLSLRGDHVPTLGFLGAMRPDKMADFIRTAQVCGTRPLRISFIGRGQLSNAQAQELHASGILVDAPNEDFLTDEVFALRLAAVDLVVAPYHQVTQSGSVMLALTAGKGVLGYADGGLSDILSEKSLVPLGDVLSMAQKVDDYLISPWPSVRGEGTLDAESGLEQWWKVLCAVGGEGRA